MEILVGLLVTLVFGLAYFKNKVDKLEVQVKQANTKAEDAVLKSEQLNVEELITQIDEGIQKIKDKRAADVAPNAYKTIEQRAKEAKERYDKK